MNDQLRNKEKINEDQSQQIASLEETNKKLSQLTELQKEQLREKDITIQILQDEFSALQLEINTTQERNEQLQKENQQLIQRWMEKMNQEAEKMNEATLFYESALQHAHKKKPIKSLFKSSSESSNFRPSTVVLPNQPYKTLSSTHDNDVYCIQASNTGKYFATGGEDRKIKLYDAYKVNNVTSYTGALQSITCIDFNKTDDYLVASSTDNSSRIWNLSTKRIVHTLTGHISKVYASRFTDDSQKVISASHDRTLKVWDLNKGYCTKTIFTFSSCNDVALMDPEGYTLISGHLDASLRIWDAKSGNGIKDLNGIHTDQITSTSLSPDGNAILTNSRDNTLNMVDIRMYKVLQTFKANTYQNGLNWSRACFSPDGCYVAAGSKDGTIHIWNTRNNQLERTLKGEHKSVICGVTWNPLGTEFYSIDKSSKTVCIWDTSIDQKSLTSFS
ncbi:WD40-repeat-containing domain protein [Cunninghamella echinulata]|nr:WD40-repeat-containing domain protein [Cunninghamella echinulata]